MIQFQKKAFTLVELIVVITILSIMGTIGFISLGGYAGLARESARIADITTISKALGIYYVENNRYPDTSSGTTVTYSGSTLWTQGYFTDSVRTELKKLSESPLDPLLGSPYIYSVTYNNQEFQLAGAGEQGGALSATSLLPQSHALFSKAIVKGNYNGAILGRQIESQLYVFGVPSIVTSQTGSSITLNSIYQNRSFVVDKFGAIPSGFRSEGQTYTPINFPLSNVIVNQNTPVVYSGALDSFTTSSGVLNLTQKIYDLYATTPLTQVEEIQNFTQVNPSSSSNQSALISETAQFVLATSTIAPLVEKTNIEVLAQATQVTGLGTTNNTGTIIGTYFGPGTQYTQNWATNSCNPSQMTLVNISPGTDTIPATLSGNTMYQLSAGTYLTTRTISASNCSAVVGIPSQTIVHKTGGNTLSAIFRNTANIRNVIYTNLLLDGLNTVSNGITFSNSSNNTIANISTYNNTYNGIELTSSSNNTINNISTYNNSFNGVKLASSSNNTIRNIISYRQGFNGIELTSSSNNTINNVLTYNNSFNGIVVQTSSLNNTINNVLSYNHSYNGIVLQSNSSSNTINNISTYNNSFNGIVLQASSNNFLNDIFTYNHSYNGIESQGSSSGNFYYGSVKRLNSGGNIVGTGLAAGTGSSIGWVNGTTNTTGTFSQDWAVIPSVSGWNFSKRGRQNLTFSGSINYTYGANIPFQAQPVRYVSGVLQLYGTNGGEYNTANRIGQW